MSKNFDLKNFDGVQFSQETLDTAVKNFNTATKSVQAIAVELAEYSKKSFEESAAVLEKMLGAKSLEKAIELQQEYVKNSYEGFMAKAAKVGELYGDLAKEAYKPYENLFGKFGK